MWSATNKVRRLHEIRYRGNIDKVTFLKQHENIPETYKPLQINEAKRDELINKFTSDESTKEIMDRNDDIYKFFKAFKIIELTEILNIIMKKIEHIKEKAPEAVLLVNTPYLFLTGNKVYKSHYKSEDFLAVELYRRNLVDIQIHQIESRHQKLPEHCILIDDACYSGLQWDDRIEKLQNYENTRFYCIIPFYSTTCQQMFEKKPKNVEIEFGEHMPSAQEIPINSLSWLTESEHKFTNRPNNITSSKHSLKKIMSTPDYKIADELSTFTAYFAELTDTSTITEHYKLPRSQMPFFEFEKNAEP